MIQNKYRRLKGFRRGKGDYVVFNFPHGDTVLSRFPAEDYYAWVRNAGREYTIANGGPLIVRPMDKEDHYVKRCVALPGDSLSVRNGLVWVNGAQQEVYPGIQLTYRVVTTGQRINERTLKKLGLNLAELAFDSDLPGYPAVALTAAMLEQVKGWSFVTSVEPNLDVFPPDFPDSYLSLFPFTENFQWTRDNYSRSGSEEGATVAHLRICPSIAASLMCTRRVTCGLAQTGRSSSTGWKPDYTFKQDYYFAMRQPYNSLDSRYGFVPEDHIVGRPALVWLSTDRNRKFPANIRWGRFFKFV